MIVHFVFAIEVDLLQLVREKPEELTQMPEPNVRIHTDAANATLNFQSFNIYELVTDIGIVPISISWTIDAQIESLAWVDFEGHAP